MIIEGKKEGLDMWVYADIREHTYLYDPDNYICFGFLRIC